MRKACHKHIKIYNYYTIVLKHYTMATQEQLKLSTYIKHVHENLRKDTKLYGSKIAWKNHCSNKENLQKYSTAMLHLATKYWDKNPIKDSILMCRIQWSYKFCEYYFKNENLLISRQKEMNIAAIINLKINQDSFLLIENKYQMLDVGSCYNPFSIFDCFNVIPIDIAPANPDVLKCDFLSLNVKDGFKKEDFCIIQMPKDHFHIVVFSLLLEYLPTTNQRYLACQKAYELLKIEGILIIITPDSKHVGANVKIMKSWQHILAKIGFRRIKYEKLPHIHCMVFRKCLNKEISKRWSYLHNKDDVFKEMHIPQDFNKINIKQEHFKEATKFTADVDLFQELPYVVDIT